MAVKQKQEKQTSWLVLIAIGMGILMAMLDITIVNVALPTIQHEFHTSYVSTQWIVNAYTATYAISILLISKLGVWQETFLPPFNGNLYRRIIIMRNCPE